MAGSNAHGFDTWDHVEVERWIDTYGNEYQGAEGLYGDDDFGEADLIVTTIVYPDGTTETRNFVGPWEDEDQYWADVQEWWDSDGTP